MSCLSPNCPALVPQAPTQLQGNGADTKSEHVCLQPQTFPMCSVQVGLVSPEVVTQLQRFPTVFSVSPSSVTFTDSLRCPDSRSAALEATLQQLRSEDVFPVLRGWRGECYVTRAESSGPALFKMDRSASKLFGVRQVRSSHWLMSP